MEYESDDAPGTEKNPIRVKLNIIDAFQFQWEKLFSRGSNTTDFDRLIRVITPDIMKQVEEGQYFCFSGYQTQDFYYSKDEYGYYIKKANSSSKIYLKIEDMSYYTQAMEKVKDSWKNLTNPIKELQNFDPFDNSKIP